MNLILSTAYGPSVLQTPLYLITLRSWAERCSHTSRMAWVVKDVPEEFCDLCRYYGVMLYDATDGDWTASGERYRHWFYGGLCRKLDADWVMTIDAKDTVFQGDPFQPAWLGEKRVSVSAECVRVRDCEWNFNECQTLAQSLREEAPVLHGDWPVINGGFAAGRPDLMALFCLSRIGMDAKIPVHSDQATITYLANATGLLNVVPPTEPWVCHGHWHEGTPHSEYALFHQWNRIRVPEETQRGIVGRYAARKAA